VSGTIASIAEAEQILKVDVEIFFQNAMAFTYKPLYFFSKFIFLGDIKIIIYLI